MDIIDYKVIYKPSPEFQKILNQWRHIFELEVIYIKYLSNNWFIAVIKRSPKEVQ